MKKLHFLVVLLLAVAAPICSAQSSSGTGFFISSDGYIVTNNHVIKDAVEVTVTDSTGAKLDAEVVRKDTANDLAILKVPQTNHYALALRSSSDVRKGATMYTLGFPNSRLQGHEAKLTEGIISSLAGIQDEPNSFQISVPLQPGNSGGPLVDSSGAVVGVVAAKLSAQATMSANGSLPENVNYAIKSNYVLELVKTVSGLAQKLRKPPTSQARPLIDTAAETERGIVFIVAKFQNEAKPYVAATALVPPPPPPQSTLPPQTSLPPVNGTPTNALIVRIGHVAPLSGPLAKLGRDNENGARLAIEELNTQGVMIGGVPAKFELWPEDDAATPQGGIAAAQRLVNAHVNGVVGHLNSGTTIPAAKIYYEAGIPQISASATNITYTHQGYSTAFRVCANDESLSGIVGRFETSVNHAKRIAVVDDGTAFGRATVEGFIGGATAASPDVVIVSRRSTTPTPGDFSALLNEIREKNADLIYFGGMDNVAGSMLSQMKQLGIGIQFAGGDGICTDALVKIAGGSLPDGQVVCVIGGGVDNAHRQSVNEFKTKYRARFGTDVQIYAPYTYDAVMTMVDAMQRAGSAMPAQYLPKLASIHHSGVTGDIYFDANGDLVQGTGSLYIYRSGVKQLIGVVH